MGKKEDDVSAQLDAMNTAYSPYGITFVQADADWTVNAAWASDSAEETMKESLRQGTYADLNVYLINSMDYLGYCYFPTSTSGSDDDFTLDGCTVLSSSIPGGSETNYDLGLTAVHEIGHWFGLYHTFQGGCVVGDRVDDTPAEASSASGCPTGRDTCPNADGEDPIHNYMDYTYDSCYVSHKIFESSYTRCVGSLFTNRSCRRNSLPVRRSACTHSGTRIAPHTSEEYRYRALHESLAKIFVESIAVWVREK